MYILRILLRFLEEIVKVITQIFLIGFRVVGIVQLYIFLILDYLSGNLKNRTLSKLMGISIISLSIASFYTTYTGMRSFVNSPIIPALITVGIQAILFAASLQIGSARLERETCPGSGSNQENKDKHKDIDINRYIPIIAVLFLIFVLFSFRIPLIINLIIISIFATALTILYVLTKSKPISGALKQRITVFAFVITLFISSLFSFNTFMGTLYLQETRNIDNFVRAKSEMMDTINKAEANIDRSSYFITKQKFIDILTFVKNEVEKNENKLTDEENEDLDYEKCYLTYMFSTNSDTSTYETTTDRINSINKSIANLTIARDKIQLPLNPTPSDKADWIKKIKFYDDKINSNEKEKAALEKNLKLLDNNQNSTNYVEFLQHVKTEHKGLNGFKADLDKINSKKMKNTLTTDEKINLNNYFTSITNDIENENEIKSENKLNDFMNIINNKNYSNENKFKLKPLYTLIEKYNNYTRNRKLLLEAFDKQVLKSYEELKKEETDKVDVSKEVATTTNNSNNNNSETEQDKSNSKVTNSAEIDPKIEKLNEDYQKSLELIKAKSIELINQMPLNFSSEYSSIVGPVVLLNNPTSAANADNAEVVAAKSTDDLSPIPDKEISVRPNEVLTGTYTSQILNIARNFDSGLNEIEKNIRGFIINPLIGILSLSIAVVLDLMILFIGMLIPKSIKYFNENNKTYSDEEIEEILNNVMT